jgi:hypothetical protein
MGTSESTDLQSRCDLLRSLHRPGDPLLLPNAWDVAKGRGRGKGWVSRGRDHELGRGRHAGL